MEKNLNTIEINLHFISSKKTYRIEIQKSLNPEIVNILKDKFKIEEYDLEIKGNLSIPPFPIKETIKVEVKEFNQKQNNGEIRLIYKNVNNDFIPIKNENKDYYIKFSIDAGLEKKHINKNDKRCSSANYLDCDNVKCVLLTPCLAVYRKSAGKKDDKELLYQATFTKYISLNQNKRNKSTPIENRKPNLKSEHNYSEEEQNNNYQSKIQILTNIITTKIFGLFNLGNTCFLNSSIQILIHSPIFIKKFLEDYNKRNNQSKDTLIYNFNEFIMEIRRSKNQVFSPRNLVDSFLKKCHLFSLGEQSDSQRFYKNFLTIIETELGPNNTCINDTFKGQFIYNMEFNCTNSNCRKYQKNIVKNSFYDIFVAVPEEHSEIIDLINKTYRTQILKSSKKCKCGNNLELVRSCTINPNQYLSVNIQRANIKTRDLKKTLIKIDNLKLDEIDYEPYAINIHDGKMDYGHYYR